MANNEPRLTQYEIREFVGRKSLVDHVIDRVTIPPYEPKHAHWEITFSALGWERLTIEKFWVLFCKINRSRSGDISSFEFLNYFNLDRCEYVEKCFEYFDTTGGESIDFLEFMVSVWNICTMKIDTLTNFTFDMYDLDSDGELSLPEIERLVTELYGDSPKLKRMRQDVLTDISNFAEERGGALNLHSFTLYTMNHSLLLFPVFRIQRAIQSKVMGKKYWVNVQRRQQDCKKGDDIHTKDIFDPRHVQILLRSYKTGGVASILAHTGDPNVALKDWFEKFDEKETLKNAESKPFERPISRWGKVRFLVESFKKSRDEKEASVIVKEAESTGKPPAFIMASRAFLDAGKVAAKKSIEKVQSSLPTSSDGNNQNAADDDKPKLKLKRSLLSLKSIKQRQQQEGEKQSTSEQEVEKTRLDKDLTSPAGEKTPTKDVSSPGKEDERPIQNIKDLQSSPKQDDTDSVISNPSLNDMIMPQYRRRRIKKKTRSHRPKTAPTTSSLSIRQGRKSDHRMQFKANLRPRTPGSISYVVDDSGDGFQREDSSKKPSEDVQKWFG